MTQWDDGTYRYYVIFDEPKISMYDIVIMTVENGKPYEESVKMDIQSVKGMKNKLFGGEGFFNTILTGPGKILLQTMPVSSFAQTIIPYIPQSSGN